MTDEPDLAIRLEQERVSLLEMKRSILAKADEHVAKIDARVGDIEGALEGIYAKRSKTAAVGRIAAAVASPAKLTIKDMTVEILALMPSGATAQEILALINERYKHDTKRESLSPQLTRLKAEGRIELRGKTWFLTGDDQKRAVALRLSNIIDRTLTNLSDLHQARAPDLLDGVDVAAE